MSARLKSYIEKIESGKPLNYRSFLRALEKEGISQAIIRDNIRVVPQGGNSLYRVDFIDKSFLDNLKSRVVTDDMSRADAALKNKSHAVRVNGSFILRRVGLAHPEVVIIDSEGGYFPSTTSNRKALVIENRQNFLSITLTAAFLQKYCDVNITGEWDVLFGAGGEISNHLHKRYLSNYSTIYMLLDLDVGGFKVAKALAARTPEANHSFIVPQDIDKRLELVDQEAPQNVIEQAYLVGKTESFLANATQSIMKHRKVLEQESYIA